jgi:pimeloyl-ACP methyl ester carboxylesterase
MTLFRRKRVLRFFPSEEEIQKLENNLYGGNVCHQKVLNFFVGQVKHTVQVHFAHWPSKTPDAPTMLLVHGNGTTGACFAECLPYLSNFNVYVLDLPGYGRTTGSCMPFQPQEIILYYSEFIESFVQQQQLQKIFVIGHSYGGFLTVHWASRYPARVTHVCLINSVGILSMLGPAGAYWAYFFKKSLLQSGRVFGKFGAWAVFNFFTFMNYGPEVFYWYSTLSHPDGWGGRCMGHFIETHWTQVAWVPPALSRLQSITVPILLIYGEDDDIIPYEQG